MMECFHSDDTLSQLAIIHQVEWILILAACTLFPLSQVVCGHPRGLLLTW